MNIHPRVKPSLFFTASIYIFLNGCDIEGQEVEVRNIDTLAFTASAFSPSPWCGHEVGLSLSPPSLLLRQTFSASGISRPFTQALECAVTPSLLPPSPLEMRLGSVQPRTAQQVKMLGRLTAAHCSREHLYRVELNSDARKRIKKTALVNIFSFFFFLTKTLSLAYCKLLLAS